jgi:hypothetical protein
MKGQTFDGQNARASREAFIAGYCARSGIAWEQLREHRIALPCDCGEEA